MNDDISIPENHYPELSDRIKAMALDWVVLFGFMLIATFVFSLFETVSDKVRMAAFLFVFVFYDPLFTSFFGGTIGHRMIGLRVKRESDEQKNILLPLALIRYLGKILFGWISLLSVTFNIKKKAIHDYLIGSVVIYAGDKK